MRWCAPRASRASSAASAPPCQGAPGHSTFYVEVGDLQATLDAIEAAGGSTVQPPMDIPNGPSIALFRIRTGTWSDSSRLPDPAR